MVLKTTKVPQVDPGQGGAGPETMRPTILRWLIMRLSTTPCQPRHHALHRRCAFVSLQVVVAMRNHHVTRRAVTELICMCPAAGWTSVINAPTTTHWHACGTAHGCLDALAAGPRWRCQWGCSDVAFPLHWLSAAAAHSICGPVGCGAAATSRETCLTHAQGRSQR